MDFVLVPGGWQGGWVFDAVVEQLRHRGHDAHAVTLAGLEADGPPDAERPANLTDHIDQVAEVVARAGEQPLALCGHSYAGLVIAGVADRLPDHIAHLVFIDAYVPDDGDSCWSLTTDQFRDMFLAGAGPDGRWVVVPDGLDPRARAHPLPSLVQSVRLARSGRPTYSRTFVSGGEWTGTPFRELTERLRADPDWRVHDIPVGHNIARRDPHALAQLLDRLART